MSVLPARPKFVALRWVIPCHSCKGTSHAKKNSTWCPWEATEPGDTQVMLPGDRAGMSPASDTPGEIQEGPRRCCVLVPTAWWCRVPPPLPGQHFAAAGGGDRCHSPALCHLQ